ncbi:Uncharacterised protein [Mycobacteroides abscessus subsp. abscessus]|nr:Uncharacterised protein [Mycobacteroides abscessus subsp. abscessus]
MRIVPRAALSSRSVTTVRTCASSRTQMPMMSDDAASSDNDDAARAPWSTTLTTASGERSKTVSPPCHFANRPAIGPPMLPSPT